MPWWSYVLAAGAAVTVFVQLWCAIRDFRNASNALQRVGTPAVEEPRVQAACSSTADTVSIADPGIRGVFDAAELTFAWAR